MPVEEEGVRPSGKYDVMLMKDDGPVVENKAVAAFKKTESGETFNKQQRMQNDSDAHNKAKVKTYVAVRVNPDFPVLHKAGKKN